MMGQSIEKSDYRWYETSAIAPLAVMLDNRFETIQLFKDTLIERGFNVFITSRIPLARQTYERHVNDASYLFDMHMTRVRKIGQRETLQGLAVGITLVCDLTNDGRGDHIDHCATLTEYDDKDIAEQSFDSLEQRGQSVTRLRKDSKYYDKFEAFVHEYELSYLDHIKVSQITKNIGGVRKSYGVLCNGSDVDEEVAAMMGFYGINKAFWDKDLESVARFSGADLCERIEALAYIRQGIQSHFGKGEIEAQREWIHAKRSEIGGRSLWSSLISGEIDQLYLVSNFVNRKLG